MPEAFIGVVIPLQEQQPETPYIPYSLGEPLPTDYIDRDSDPVIAELFTRSTDARLFGDYELDNLVKDCAERYARLIGNLAIVPILRRGKLGIIGDILGTTDEENIIDLDAC